MVRVLFIDDDPRAQDTLRWILAGRYAVVHRDCAAEGAAGGQRVQTGRPGLLQRRAQVAPGAIPLFAADHHQTSP